VSAKKPANSFAIRAGKSKAAIARAMLSRFPPSEGMTWKMTPQEERLCREAEEGAREHLNR
jgi:hypothetical protein